MTYFSQSDNDLKQAVVDKDFQWFGEVLSRRACTAQGIDRALYQATAYGQTLFFAPLLDYTKNRQPFHDGTLIWSIFSENADLYLEALDCGADIHHRNEAPLQTAVKLLRTEFATDLVERGAKLDVAFPAEDIQALFRRMAEGKQAQKTLELISVLKTGSDHKTAVAASAAKFTPRLV